MPRIPPTIHNKEYLTSDSSRETVRSRQMKFKVYYHRTLDNLVIVDKTRVYVHFTMYTPNNVWKLSEIDNSVLTFIGYL